MYLFESMELNDLSLNLNSLDCLECRSPFKEELRDYLAKNKESLCADCQRRAKTNPLRVFDCKVEACNQVVSDAPSILEFLCLNLHLHFNIKWD